MCLQLERNIRSIGLSGDWLKLVEGFSNQSSTSQTPATAAESTQKHRSGRRGRKHSLMSEIVVKDTLKLNDFTWFRGSTLSELRFQRGILPRSILKSFARQGNIGEFVSPFRPVTFVCLLKKDIKDNNFLFIKCRLNWPESAQVRIKSHA